MSVYKESRRASMTEEQYKSGLLTEAGELKGSFGAVMGKWKGRIKKFGKTLAAAAKLLTEDIAYMLKLTFSFRSKTINEARRKHRQRRNALIKDLDKSVQDSLSDSDAKFMAFAIAPSVMATSAVFGVVGKPFDPEWRESVGEWGADKLPLVGGIFSRDFNSRETLLGELAEADSPEKVAQIMSRKLENLTGIKTGKPNSGIGLSAVAIALTSIFLLKEGNELEDDSESIDASTDQMLDAWFENYLEENMPDISNDVLEMKESELEEVFKGAPEIIDAAIQLTVTEEPKDFIKILKQMKKSGGEKLQSIDIEKIESGMDSMVEKIESDEKSIKKIKDDLTNLSNGSEKEPSDKEVQKEIKKVIMIMIKSQFVQTVKEELGDYMEKAYSFLWDGLTDEQINELKKTPSGEKYFNLCSSYDKQFEEAISKLKNV